MDGRNICRFIPDGGKNEKLHVINFVLETKQRNFVGLKNSSVYQIYLVKKGDGILHTSGGTRKLKEGDIFFTFPSAPFAIEDLCDFEYMYISYLGARASKIHDSLGINRHNCVFEDFGEAVDFWTSSLQTPKEASALRIESVLLYSFSLLAQRILPKQGSSSSDDAVLLIKKHIDDNLSSCELSLDTISSELSYNAKYISSLFKKKMGIGITEYISTVRIQHACALMEQGFTSIKDISALCGFKDALYFSKVFKQKMAISPREHITRLSRQEL